MQVVYHLWSETTPDWLRVIVDGLARDDPRVPSVTFLWKGAEWMEREAYDMFGIVFEGNRDLRRIYMPPDYVSFPLRKDFYLADDVARVAGRRRPAHGAGRTRPSSIGRAHPAQPGALTRESAMTTRIPSARRPAASSSTTPATIYDAIPPYPPRTRARGRVLHAPATARCS